MFVSNFYLRSTIDLFFRSIILLEVGRRYTEVIHHDNLVENKDYHYNCRHLFFFLRIETLNTYANAIKYGYVKDPHKGVDTDVEMTDSTDNNRYVIH